MNRFSFDRSVLLGSIVSIPGGLCLIKSSFRPANVLKIRRRNVKFVRTKQLADSSVVVIDFGPKGAKTRHAIIAAGNKSRVRASLKVNNSNFVLA